MTPKKMLVILFHVCLLFFKFMCVHTQVRMPITPPTSEKEMHTLNLAASLASIVYENDTTEIEAWSCLKCHVTTPRPSLRQVIDSTTERALITFHDSNPYLMVTFRGDIDPVFQKLNQWMPLIWGHPTVWKLNIFPFNSSFPNPLQKEEAFAFMTNETEWSIPVFQYAFTKYFQSGLRERILKELQLYLNSPNHTNPNTQVKNKVQHLVFSGHSMGGCLALFTAIEVKNLGLWNSSLTVYTFNSPKTGGTVFNQVLKYFNIQVIRVVEENDVITHIPLSSVFQFQPNLHVIVQGHMYNCTSLTNSMSWSSSSSSLLLKNTASSPCSSISAPSLLSVYTNMNYYIHLHFQYFQHPHFFTYPTLTLEKENESVINMKQENEEEKGLPSLLGTIHNILEQ